MHDYTTFSLDQPLFDDLPTISFEMKPKCATDIDNRCKFCWKQDLKLKSEQIQKVTKYCPKKLYSIEYNDVYEAVESLFENPQNNLQVYLNSSLIYSNKHTIENLKEKLTLWKIGDNVTSFIKILTKILQYQYEFNCEICGKHKFTVLQQLKDLQQLDGSNKPPITNEHGYVEILLSLFDNIAEECLFCRRDKLLQVNSELSKHYLSKIARDCSIMLTVKQLPDQRDPEVDCVEIEGVYYIFKVRVFDLFAKDEK